MEEGGIFFRYFWVECWVASSASFKQLAHTSAPVQSIHLGLPVSSKTSGMTLSIAVCVGQTKYLSRFEDG